MDKTDVESGLGGIGPVELFLQKSKKLRRLGSVNVSAGPSNELDSSDGVNMFVFRSPTKFSDGLNAVDHACIPRKLRSGMKKPNLRSLSSHSPKSKKRVEPCKNGGIKKHEILKLEQGIRDLSEKPTGSESGLISKDEEEVVQSLFALAGMSRDDDEDEALCPVSPVTSIEDGATSNSHTQAAAENESLPIVDNTDDEAAKLSTPAVQNITMKEPGENEGLTLWGDLFSTATITTGSQSPSEVAAAKLPALVQPTISNFRQSSPRTSSSKLVSEVTAAKKAVKRSMAHICISHFIQTLKKQEDKANMSLVSQDEELKGRVYFPFPNCSRVEPDGMNITVAATKSPNLAANGNPSDSFDFLYLSTGDGSLHGNSAGKGPGSSSQLQVPHLQALPIQSILPFSMPQTHHPPFTYVNQISTTSSQVERQLPQCLNAALSETSHISQSGLSKQEQQLWAIQLSANYRQVRHQASPTLKLSSSAFPTSSLESILPKQSSVLQFRQPMMAGSSLPAEMMKIQQLLTPVCEETENKFRPQTGLTLQLL